VIGVQHVVAELLKAYNFGEAEEPDPENPPEPKPRPEVSVFAWLAILVDEFRFAP